MNHPAKYTESILNTLQDLTVSGRILDPFAGTGRIHELAANLFVARHTIGVEIEPEWATLHHRTIVGNALNLPFPSDTFDGVVTSCTYGNRLADNHAVYDDSTRYSYTFALGRKLHADNSGQMQWGDDYRAFHTKVWYEVKRVLRPGAQFILNCKDHIRAGVRQYVCAWHLQTLMDLEFRHQQTIRVAVPSLTFGTNSEARVPYEELIVCTL